MGRLLLTILALLGLMLPLYHGTEAGRLIREAEGDNSNVDGSDWVNGVMRALDEDDDDGDVDDGKDEDDGKTDGKDEDDGKTELVDEEDMKYQENESTDSTTTTSTPRTSSTSTTSTTSTSSEDSKSTSSTSTSTSTSTKGTTTTTTESSTTENQECYKPNDLTTYCEISDDFKDYMQGNTTADAMAAKLFSPIVINQLISMCNPGDWCLNGDYIQLFADKMSNFFDGPLCSQGLMDCADLMIYRRKGCPDMVWLYTFTDSLSLLCEMYDVAEITPDCFGHTIATLHVTLADQIRETSKQINYGDEFCLGAYVGMTRKFMCTLEKCPNHQDLFEDYKPWEWFMEDAPVIKQVCQLESVCGDQEAIAEKTDSTSWSSTTEYTYPPTEQKVPIDKGGYPGTSQDKPTFIIQSSDESARYLIGITTGTVVAVFGLMVLLCALIKRMRRRGRRVTKDGYAKLPTDE